MPVTVKSYYRYSSKVGELILVKGLSRKSAPPLTEEHKRNLSQALKGIPKSPLHRTHIRLAQKAIGQEEWKREICRQNFAGKPKTPEQIIKLREARAKQVVTEETKRKLSIMFSGKGGPFYGRHHREDTIQRNREAHIGLMAGEKHWNWRGGIGKEPYPFYFTTKLKEAIRDRDGRVCQLCGIPECECLHKLAVHHIDYNKKNCSWGNLISLCSPCNLRVNLNRKHWRQLFNSQLLELLTEVKQ